MAIRQPVLHSGIDILAEATRIVQKFGGAADQYMTDWIATYSPEHSMAVALRAVQVEVQRQVALI